MGPLYLNTVYLHLKWILSPGAAMFFTVMLTGQTKQPFEFLGQLKATTGSLSCLEGEGELRGIQLQHATSPLDVTKLFTLHL